MVSLYGRLFAYRQRPTRSPKEDYLTEALADLLSRMPADKSSQFVVDLLLPRQARDDWEQFHGEGSDWRWRTQVGARANNEAGRVDLALVAANGTPILVVENKIHAPGELHQLQFYGGWIARERGNEPRPGAVCFLTHATPVPTEFMIGRNEQLGLWRHSRHWHQVWSWLEREARPNQAAACAP